MLDAVQLLAQSAASAETFDARLTFLDALVPLCVDSGLRQCLADHVGEYARLAGARATSPSDNFIGSSSGVPARSRALVAMTAERLLAGDFQGLDRLGLAPLLAKIEPDLDRTTYIKAHILLAQIASARGDTVASAREADIAFGGVLVQAARSGYTRDYVVARALTELIELAFYNQDSERAIVWLTAASPLLDAAFAKGSIGELHYLGLRSNLLNAFAPESAGQESAHLAVMAALHDIQLPAELEHELRSLRTTQAAAVALWRRNPERARKMVADNPLSADIERVLSGGQLPDSVTMLSAVVRLATEVASGVSPDSRWRAIFDRRPGWMANDDKQFEAYWRFGRAMTQDLATVEAQDDLIQAAAADASFLTSMQGKNPFGFVVPMSFDNLIFGLASLALVPRAGADAFAANLLVQIRDLANRRLTERMSDTLALIASQTSDANRRLMHSDIQVSRQKLAWERARIGEMVARGKSEKPAPLESNHADELLAKVAEFSDTLRDLRNALPLAAVAPATVDNLQSSLQPDEVLIAHVLIGEIGYGLCIRADMHIAYGGPLEAQHVRALTVGLKSVANALTSSFPADSVLDSQYPVDSAIDLYNTLFRPLAECMAGAKRMIYVRNAKLDALTSLPVAAILTGVPAKDVVGFRLDTAPWLGRAFEISYASSFSAFLASRSIAATSGGDLPFLGVGDPILADAGARFSDLPELPDTSAELSAIASRFPGATLLTRAEATEVGVRSQPLSRYDVIAFATHGLIRDDIPGLADAALVLTPNATDDPFDDGLFTASEIGAIPLRARLAVLSACNSVNLDLDVASGQAQGLTLGLAIAGVPTTIASLWPVDSEQTRGFMDVMFQSLRRGASASSAAAAAAEWSRTTSGIRAYAHPRFWAAFILQGEPATTLLGDGRREVAPLIESPEGEIVGAAASRSGQGIYTSVIGPFDGARHASILERRDAMGALNWSREDLIAGAGEIAASDGGVAALGYGVAPADSGDVAFIQIGATDETGARRWTRQFNLGPIPSKAGLAVDRRGAIYVGYVSSRGSEARPDYLLNFLKLNRDGANVFHRVVPAASGPDTGPPDRIEVGVIEDRPVFLVSHRRTGVRDGFGNNDFHQRRSCFTPSGVSSFSVDPADGAPIANRFYPGIKINRLAPDGEALILLGSEAKECDVRGTAVAARLDRALDITMLWRDQTPFSSEAAGVLRRKGRLWIAGTSRRVIRIDERLTARSMDEYLTTGQLLTEGSETFEPFVVPADGGESATYLNFGLSSIVSGAVETRRGAFIYGLVGARQLWYRLE